MKTASLTALSRRHLQCRAAIQCQARKTQRSLLRLTTVVGQLSNNQAESSSSLGILMNADGLISLEMLPVVDVAG